MNALIRLDAKVLPRLSRGLVRVGGVIRARRVRPLTVVATTLVLAVGATALWRLVRPEPGGSYGTSPVWVGVRDGDSIPEYVESSRAKLEGLAATAADETVFALVSFGQYLTPDQVASVVGAVPGIDSVVGYGRVPLPGRQTQRVSLPAERLPGDLVAGMVAVADDKDRDAGTYESSAAKETNESLRLTYASNAALDRAEATAYRAACACVFALLVRATPNALTTLAGRAEVRAVEPAPDVNDPRGAVILAPLPEQVGRVEPPPDESLPAD